MPRSAQDAFPFGFLVLVAEDMYDSQTAPPEPPNDPRVAAFGWDIVAHIRAQEPNLPLRGQLAAGEQKRIHIGPRQVFIGFIAKKRDENLIAAAIRGTSGFVEWVIDADFPDAPYDPSLPGLQVEDGFFNLYKTFRVYDLNGAPIGANFVDGVLSLIGANRLVVSGHSLGAALATYASLALARVKPAQIEAVLFASPRTGNSAFAHFYDSALSDYTLINYALDIVPRVPFTAPGLASYATLPKATVITPHSSEADIRVDIACSHHLVDYLAMLNYAQSLKLALDAKGEDASLRQSCLIGPREWSLNDDLAAVLSFTLAQLENETVVKALAKRMGWKAI